MRPQKWTKTFFDALSHPFCFFLWHLEQKKNKKTKLHRLMNKKKWGLDRADPSPRNPSWTKRSPWVIALTFISLKTFISVDFLSSLPPNHPPTPSPFSLSLQRDHLFFLLCLFFSNPAFLRFFLFRSFFFLTSFPFSTIPLELLMKNLRSTTHKYKNSDFYLSRVFISPLSISFFLFSGRDSLGFFFSCPIHFCL